MPFKRTHGPTPGRIRALPLKRPREGTPAAKADHGRTEFAAVDRRRRTSLRRAGETPPYGKALGPVDTIYGCHLVPRPQHVVHRSKCTQFSPIVN